MELRDLRYFASVAEHQNIGRAAEALDLSATALGKSLRRLEKSVGAKLVQRASKGVALTAVGAALLTRIGPLQGMLNDVRHEAAGLARGEAGHINVGSNAGIHENRIADAYVALSNESPAITVKVTVSTNDVLSKGLHKGEIDFCVAGPQSFSPTEFVHEHLSDDPFIVFASAHHRFAKRKQVSVVDLASERWATSNSTSLPQWQALFRAFEDNGLPPPSMALETNSVVLRTMAIAYSDHLGVTSRQFLRQKAQPFSLVELPMKELSLVRRMSIIYRKGAYLSPTARRLIEILKTHATETSASARDKRRRS
jgi:DNA-binding transcriptional LysR family regulator